MLDRIRQLMESKGLSASQFADGMDVPRAVLSHIMSGRNKPSLDVVMKIASTYADVDLEWLLLGKGEMLTSLASKPAVKLTQINIPVIEIDEATKEIILDGGIEKVQKNIVTETAPTTPVQSTKEVKQVMFFYTDGTFEAFKPGA